MRKLINARRTSTARPPYHGSIQLGDNRPVKIRLLIVASFLALAACDTSAERRDPFRPTVNSQTVALPNSTSTTSAPALDRRTVMKARRRFVIQVLSFDASQQYGNEFPYSDRVRLKITNNSNVTLPCLTVLTKRYAAGEMVGSSRTPSIPTRDIAPGESVEYEYYPRGHLDVVSVDRIGAEVEDVVSSENEQFICELQGVGSQSSSQAPGSSTEARHRIEIGTPADSVLAWLGRSIGTQQIGRDEQGLLVKWEYSDVIYTMGRRIRDGIEAYRVIKITPKP